MSDKSSFSEAVLARMGDHPLDTAICFSSFVAVCSMELWQREQSTDDPQVVAEYRRIMRALEVAYDAFERERTTVHPLRRAEDFTIPAMFRRHLREVV